MLIGKILNFLKTNKKTLFYIACIAVFFMIAWDGVFAEGPNSDSADKSESTNLYNALIQTVSTGIGMLSSIVGLFLNPSWTNGTGIWLHVHLKDLWIMISNIVYVIFAFLLIIIAFMNIIWKGDKWELKQALPKFFIWVLIVPFSWMFVQVVIAISSFLSVSVLMLPYDVLSNSPTNSWEEIKAKPVCTTYIVVSKSQGKDQSANTANTSWCGGTTSIAELLKSDGVYGLLNIYTYGIFSLDQLSQINGQEVDSFTSLFKIGINLIVILLFAIIYFILMVSLCLALFVRWMWLWMYMIFSPVFGLLYFFDKSKDGFMEGKFSISEFVSLAMVPVYVSAALAFGLLFIFVAGWSFGDNPDTDWFVDYKEKPVTSSDYPGTSSGAEISKEAWNGQRITILKNFNLDMYGDFVTSWKQTDGLFDVMKSGFGTLLMQLFGLAVLWVAVMAAINQSKITQAVVEPIASFGKQVGGLIQKSPQYAPIFGGQSMTSLKNASGTVAGEFQSAQARKWTQFAQKHFSWVMGDDKAQKIQQIATWNTSNTENAMWVHDKIMSEVDSAQDIINHPAAHRKLTEIYERLLDEWKIKKSWKDSVEKFKSASTAMQLKEALQWIDEHGQAWFTILWWDDIVRVSDMDQAISKFVAESRTVDVDQTLKVSSGSKTINWEEIKYFRVLWVDLNLTQDWKVDESDAKIFINKFQDEWLIGKVSEKDFRQKLWQTKIKDEAAKDEFMEYIAQFIDETSNEYVEAWWQTKNINKLFKEDDSSN